MLLLLLLLLLTLILIIIIIHMQTYIGRGDDTVGIPHRAQVYQFELFERKFFNSAFRAYPLIEIIRAVRCRAIRGKSSDSRQQHLSQQYPPPLLL